MIIMMLKICACIANSVSNPVINYTRAVSLGVTLRVSHFWGLWENMQLVQLRGKGVKRLKTRSSGQTTTD